MIKTIGFDLGGVIMTIDNDEPRKRFFELGVADIDHILDPYVQSGFFGDLENGLITDEEFRQKLSQHVGRELSWAQCQHAWLGYVADVPQRNLDLLTQLRAMGYRLILGSNTNAFVQAWADSPEFSAAGLPVSHYFDAMYRSYEMREMKPNDTFFRHILTHEQTLPADILFVDDSARNCAAASELGMHTFCPHNGTDWTESLLHILQA